MERERSFFSIFDDGSVTIGGETANLGMQPWNRHKEFEGVYLKNVVTADKTGGAFTCLLVRMDPGRKIGMHTHPESMELHEVIFGSGTCVTEQGDIHYVPGSVAVLAANSPHEVRAGESGLCIFAKFIIVSA